VQGRRHAPRRVDGLRLLLARRRGGERRMRRKSARAMHRRTKHQRTKHQYVGLAARLPAGPHPRNRKGAAATALARLGGSCLVLGADTAKLNAAILDDLRGDVRRVMREARIPYSSLTARDGGLDVRVREPGDLPRAMTALATGPSGGALDLRDMGDGLIRLAPTPSDLDDRLTAALNQTIDTIRQRLQGLGATPAGVERHGADRILILLPGNKDPTRLAQVLLPKSELEFRLIDVSISPDAAQRNGAPPDAEVLYGFKIKYPYVVKTHVEIGGQDIADANASIDSRTQAPV